MNKSAHFTIKVYIFASELRQIIVKANLNSYFGIITEDGFGLSGELSGLTNTVGKWCGNIAHHNFVNSHQECKHPSCCC